MLAVHRPEPCTSFKLLLPCGKKQDDVGTISWGCGTGGPCMGRITEPCQQVSAVFVNDISIRVFLRRKGSNCAILKWIFYRFILLSFGEGYFTFIFLQTKAEGVSSTPSVLIRVMISHDWQSGVAVRHFLCGRDVIPIPSHYSVFCAGATSFPVSRWNDGSFQSRGKKGARCLS